MKKLLAYVGPLALLFATSPAFAQTLGPTGKPTKGSKTRTNKATDKYIIRSRHLKKAR